MKTLFKIVGIMFAFMAIGLAAFTVLVAASLNDDEYLKPGECD